LPFRASVAVAESLEKLEIKSELKWPNDVLVDGEKICGILVETVNKKAVVGIGLNIETAPLEESTCIESLVDRSVSLDKMMRYILKSFYEIEEVIETYKKYSSTIGQYVQIKTPDGELEAYVEDIDERGRLVLDEGRKVLAGDVVHLRKDINS